MENIKVKDLPIVSTIQMTNELLVLTDTANNIVSNVTINNFNENIISADADNIINIGTDGKLYAQTASIADDIENLNETIGDLDDLGTSDKTSIVNAVNEIASTSVNGANKNLSNLTKLGNAKFQFAPFSINNGVVSNGENKTLTTVGDVPVEIDKYIVPVLSSNSSSYGTCNDYTMTGIKTPSYSEFTNPFEMELANDNHIPSGAEVTFTISTSNNSKEYAKDRYNRSGCSGVKIVYTYIDDTTETILDEDLTGNFATWTYGSGAHSAEITLQTPPSMEVKKITLTGYKHFYNHNLYFNAWNITFKAKYNSSSADTLICKPCTITTADSKTKSFEADTTLDCSNLSNGNYKVMKSYSDGSLSLVSDFTISKTSPLNPVNNDLWLDTSEYPLILRQYDNGEWEINNDLVYLGNITVSNGIITAIDNVEFNKYRYLLSFNQTFLNNLMPLTTPDYENGIEISYPTSLSVGSYTAPSVGYFMYQISRRSAAAEVYIKVNNYYAVRMLPWSTGSAVETSGMIMVNKNDIITFISEKSGDGYDKFIFYPIRGKDN